LLELSSEDDEDCSEDCSDGDVSSASLLGECKLGVDTCVETSLLRIGGLLLEYKSQQVHAALQID